MITDEDSIGNNHDAGSVMKRDPPTNTTTTKRKRHSMFSVADSFSEAAMSWI
jgi:hypothetical protein